MRAERFTPSLVADSTLSLPQQPVVPAAPRPTKDSPVSILFAIMHYNHTEKGAFLTRMLQACEGMASAGYTVDVIVASTEPIPQLDTPQVLFPALHTLTVHQLDASLKLNFSAAARALILQRAVADSRRGR